MRGAVLVLGTLLLLRLPSGCGAPRPTPRTQASIVAVLESLGDVMRQQNAPVVVEHGQISEFAFTTPEECRRIAGEAGQRAGQVHEVRMPVSRAVFLRCFSSTDGRMIGWYTGDVHTDELGVLERWATGE